MFRDELKTEISNLIDSVIPENTTLTEENIVAVEQALEDLQELVDAAEDEDGDTSN